MIPVLSAKQARDLDAHFIKVSKVPSVLLMENAGRGAAEAIRRALGEDLEIAAKKSGPVVVVAGTGNNGGDGFVVARHLLGAGLDTDVLLVGDDAKLGAEAKTMRDAFVGVGGNVQSWKGTKDGLSGARLVVDALFGTGLSRALEGEAAAAVTAMAESGAPIVALDVPSGMNADTGEILGVAARAQLTCTFGHLKMGLLTTTGAAYAGKIKTIAIGVPASLPSEAKVTPVAHVYEAEDVAAWIPARPLDAHKHSIGHVALICGSVGKLGAAWMASEGALRGGAGAVTIVTWHDAALGLQGRVVEQMTASIDDNAIETSVDKALDGKRVALIGPGFGTDAKERRVLDRVLASELPIVLDADALTMLAGQLSILKARRAATILTPHAGELGRLLGETSKAVEADRLSAVKRASEASGAVVVLKGPRTLIAGPDGDGTRVLVNVHATPALATAGSGDTLAGITTAFACTMPAFEAVAAAVFVHADAAERWAKAHGDRGLVATDIAAGVPDVLLALHDLAKHRRPPGKI